MIGKMFAVVASVLAGIITSAIVIAAQMSFGEAVITAVIIGGICGYFIGGRHSAPRVHLREEEYAEPQRNRWLRIFD